MPRDHGFAIVELLIATAISLTVVASVFALVEGTQRGFLAEGERADQQQRLRVATDALAVDLAMAGGGAYQGHRVGPLGFFVASVLPYLLGASAANPASRFRTDGITILRVAASSAAQTTIRLPVAAQSGVAFINLDPGCPPGAPSCGFESDMDVMAYDETGAFDTFRVVAAQGDALQLQHTMADAPKTYAAGSALVEVVTRSYYLKVDPVAQTYQLMRSDVVGSDVPVVDHVVGLSFAYFGEPSPPLLVKPVTDATGPWTTYGPKPPPPTAQLTSYPAGENCVFLLDPAGQQSVPRLQFLGAGTTLVPLAETQLTDGPWCPDPASPNRFDADLFRIRKVGVTLRLETPLATLRGPAGILFMRGGTARAPSRWIPDQEIRFEVTPRNVNLGK